MYSLYAVVLGGGGRPLFPLNFHMIADCCDQLIVIIMLLNLNCNLPSNPWFWPSGHGAVQPDCFALPHSLSTGLDNKLRRVRQPIWVHFLTKL